MEILTEYGLELLFGLITAATLGFARLQVKKRKELEDYKNADQNRIYRQMILDEIEPLIEEIHRVQKDMETKIDNLKDHHNNDRDKFAKDIDLIDKKNAKNLELIVQSYKFRFIQLCKTHLRDKYVTQDEFDQITEMYKLYHGLGGNGQAQEYYERVLELPIVEKAPNKIEQ